ncbi:MAG: hypothetical protein O2794_00115 [bacterium]|nr:hypothetical protein [bacterium]
MKFNISIIKQKFLIALGFILLILAVFLGGFMYLLWNQIIPLSEQFLEVQREIKTAEEQIDTFKILVAPDLKKNELEFKRIQNLFFSEERAFEFIVFLEQTAARHNLAQTISNPPSEKTPRTTVQIRGKEGDILQFMNEIENGTFLVRVAGVSFSSSPGNSSASLDLVLRSL